MPPQSRCGRRQLVESDADHEPDPRDIEIHNLRMQIRQLTQCLEGMARLNHSNDFNDGSGSDEFTNLFHNRSSMRRHQNMKRHVREDNEREVNIKLEIPEYNETMK